MAAQNPVAGGELLYIRHIGSVQLVTPHLYVAPHGSDAAILVPERNSIFK